MGRYTSIALDGSGFPHISYHGNSDLKYAFQDESGWYTETVDAGGVYMGWYTSIALDGTGKTHISYYDAGQEDLKYAYRSESGWHTETVDEVGLVGKYTSIALDGLGYPHISYFDDTNDNLKYARAPVPTPIVLTASLADGQLVLIWTAVTDAAAYWVYSKANEPWFLPDLSPPTYVNRVAVVPAGTTTWSSPNGIGDPDHNRAYLVIAVNNGNQELTRSNRVGEHDFQGDIP